jgi:hypothetical protein
LAIGGERAVFGSALAVALVWLAVAATMRRPGRYRSQTVRLGDDALRQPGKLAELIGTAPGVVEVVVAADEGCAYLKIDPARFDATAFDRIVQPQPAHAPAGSPQG